MKNLTICITLILSLFFAMPCIQAQTGKAKTTTTKKQTTTSKSKTHSKKPSAPAPVKEVTVILHNDSEGTVSVFAGHKEDLKEPKLTIVGGKSDNRLYLKTNDVVCIISKGKTVACAGIKSSTTKLSISLSGQEIMEK